MSMRAHNATHRPIDGRKRAVVVGMRLAVHKLFCALRLLEWVKRKFDSQRSTSVIFVKWSSCILLGLFFLPTDAQTAATEQNLRVDWLANPVWDGSVRIPSGEVKITWTLTGDRQVQKTMTVGRISGQSRQLRRLLQDIKYKSLPGQPNSEREFRGIRLFYKDGTTRDIKFTSRNLIRVDGIDAEKAMNLSRAFSNPDLIEQIVDIHTHPTPEFLRAAHPELSDNLIIFGPQDIETYLEMQVQLKRATGRVIPIRAFVLPNCSTCSDLFFSLTF